MTSSEVSTKISCDNCSKLKKEIEKLTSALDHCLTTNPTNGNDSECSNKGQTTKIRCPGYLGPALIKALETRSTARVVELLSRRADVKYHDANSGSTSLIVAAKFNCPPAIVKQLLDSGACPNEADNAGMSALYHAVQNDELVMAKVLLENRADVNFSGLHHNKTPLMYAAERGQTNFVKLFLEHGAKLDAKATPYGWTALLYATMANQLESAEVLVDAGANVNLASVGPHNYKSVTYSSLTATRNLLVSKGTTPLMGAAENGNLDFVLLLLSAGANVNPINDEGSTALTLAGKDEIRRALKEHERLCTISEHSPQ